MFGARFFLLAALTACPAVALDVAPLAIEVRARALRPGDPLRIDVTSPCAVESMSGEFLGRPIHLVRAGEDGGSEHWSGWSMIGLDRQPGPAVVEIRGNTASGRSVAGTHALTIEPWEFPEEQLSVAPRYVEPPQSVKLRLQREREKLSEVYRSRRAVVPPREPFEAPVPGGATSAFGTRRIFNGQPRDPHSGLDLRAAAGTPVHGSGPGIVMLAEELYYSGNTVIVDHGGGLFTIYAHLSELRVGAGDSVEAGDLLGLSGATGRVTGPHLHWGAKIGDVPFDATALLDRRLW